MARFKRTPNLIYTDIDNITDVVCKHFDISREQITSINRRRDIVEPRQIAMYLCWLKTGSTLTEIGEYFNRGHDTVIHSRKTIMDLMEYDEELAATVEHIRLKL